MDSTWYILWVFQIWKHGFQQKKIPYFTLLPIQSIPSCLWFHSAVWYCAQYVQRLKHSTIIHHVIKSHWEWSFSLQINFRNRSVLVYCSIIMIFCCCLTFICQYWARLFIFESCQWDVSAMKVGLYHILAPFKNINLVCTIFCKRWHDFILWTHIFSITVFISRKFSLKCQWEDLVLFTQ